MRETIFKAFFEAFGFDLRIDFRVDPRTLQSITSKTMGFIKLLPWYIFMVYIAYIEIIKIIGLMKLGGL